MKTRLIFILFVLIGFDSVAQLYKLSELDTVKEYKSLEEALKNPDAVIRLTLKGKKLKPIPKEVFLFKNLQELNIRKTKIDLLPKEIGDLKNLQILDVSKNELVTLPPEIGLLTNLKNIKS